MKFSRIFFILIFLLAVFYSSRDAYALVTHDSVLIYTTFDSNGVGQIFDGDQQIELGALSLEARRGSALVSEIKFTRLGTALQGDFSNFQLQRDGVRIGSGVEAGDMISVRFDTPQSLPQGTTALYTLFGDVFSGIGKNVAFDVIHSSDISAVSSGSGGLNVYKSEYSTLPQLDSIVAKGTPRVVSSSNTVLTDDDTQAPGSITYLVTDPDGATSVRHELNTNGVLLATITLYAKDEDARVESIALKNIGNAVFGVRNLAFFKNNMRVSEIKNYENSYVVMPLEPNFIVTSDQPVTLELRGDIFDGQGKTIGFDIVNYHPVNARGMSSGAVLNAGRSTTGLSIVPDRIAFDTYVNPFSDVQLADLMGMAAYDLSQRGVLRGYPDGTFKPNKAINRAETLKILLLARDGQKFSNVATSTFTDIDSGAWYAPYILKATNEGVVRGYNDGLFRPSNTVTTAEFLKMIALTFGLEENLGHDFDDVPPDAWYAKYAGLASRYKLFTESRSQELLPNKTLTRREVAIALYHFLQNR
jgi:hypothetical protein